MLTNRPSPPVQTDTPLVSLLVCTYNRASVLSETLESLLNQEFGWGDYEILVVDNASTDETSEITAQFQARDERVRYVFEPRLGVAIARNTGAREAHAPYIAYFDDDLIAEPDCLHSLIAPFFEVDPKPLAVMGKVDLRWDGQRPDWFPTRFETMLSRFDRGNTPRFMTPNEYLITMNVAFERKSFLASGGVREDLSRKGRMFICGGDNEVFHRYMQLGWLIFYEPRALIYHMVPPSRQTKQWLIKRLFGDGTTQAMFAGPFKDRRSLVKDALIDLRRCIRFLLEIIWGKVSRNSELAEASTYKLVQRVGRLVTHFNLLIGRGPWAPSEL